MKVTQIGIEISKLANQVADVSAPALAATDCHRLPIVEILPSGRVEIVDGFHRIAGMIAAGETIIPCLTCDNEDVLAAAANAEDPVAQLAALKMIYA